MTEKPTFLDKLKIKGAQNLLNFQMTNSG